LVVRLRAKREPTHVRRLAQGGRIGAAKIHRYRDQASLALRVQIQYQQAVLRRHAQAHLMLKVHSRSRCDFGDVLALSSLSSVTLPGRNRVTLDYRNGTKFRNPAMDAALQVSACHRVGKSRRK
jgi:hypothetical protein